MFSTFYLRYASLLLLLACLSSRLCSGLKCYTGVSHKIEHSDFNKLNEVQCARKYQHQQPYLHQQDGHLSTPHLNVTYSLQSSESKDDADNKEITNCVIFYKPGTDLADFACDYDNICHGATSTKQISLCHKGSRGDLFCCQGELCNMEMYMRRLSPPQASTICYNGTNNGKINLNEVSCKSSWCYQSALFMTNGHMVEQKFGCEDECAEPEFELNGALCKEKMMHHGVRERICYCSADRCNSVVHPVYLDHEDMEPGHFPPTISPKLKMYDAEQERRDQLWKRRLILSGWIGAAILSVLAISLVAVIIYKCRQQQAVKSVFSYSQIASTTEQEEKLVAA